MRVGSKSHADLAKRENTLAAHIRANPSQPFNIASLARSYALPAERVAAIVKRTGGRHG